MDYGKILIPRKDGKDIELLKELHEIKYPNVPEYGHKYAEMGSNLGYGFQSILDRKDFVDAVQDGMRIWKEAYSGYHNFIHETWPIAHKDWDGKPTGLGSTSGHQLDPDGKLIVYVTHTNVPGSVNGCWHEFGHLRLHALGVDMETNENKVFFTNQEHKYVSPVRKDKYRPLTACLHGLYAWSLMMAYDLKIYKINPDHLVFMKMNFPKVEEGVHTLSTKADMTESGHQLLDEYFDWCLSMVKRVKRILGKDQVKKSYADHRAWIESVEVTDYPLDERGN